MHSRTYLRGGGRHGRVMYGHPAAVMVSDRAGCVLTLNRERDGRTSTESRARRRVQRPARARVRYGSIRRAILIWSRVKPADFDDGSIRTRCITSVVHNMKYHNVIVFRYLLWVRMRVRDQTRFIVLQF